jgi:hypothetical protein
MGRFLLQFMASAKHIGTSNRWFSIFAVETQVDPAALLNWRAEGRTMRVQASAQAEKPPLLSY